MQLASTMSSLISLIFALCLHAVLTSALPSTPPQSSENVDGVKLVIPSNRTMPIPFPAHPVRCFHDSRPPKPSHCTFVLNEILLRGRSVFTKRQFIHQWYRREDGQYARSRWTHLNCQISVQGYREEGQMLSFSDIASTALIIISECVSDVTDPNGGVSVVGDRNLEFVVFVQGNRAPESVSANDSHVSHESAIGAVAGRGMRFPDNSERIEGSQSVEIRDSARETSRTSAAPFALDFTLSRSGSPEYPVHCFNPMIILIPPAVPKDCSRIINQVILRLSDPTQNLTFGFTDAADINLSKPEYRKWQEGQCAISVKNNDMAEIDEFRLIDVATAARRITSQCVVATQEKLGGAASVGTDGRGFYVYVGAPLDSSPSPTNVVSWLNSTGLKSR